MDTRTRAVTKSGRSEREDSKEREGIGKCDDNARDLYARFIGPLLTLLVFRFNYLVERYACFEVLD